MTALHDEVSMSPAIGSTLAICILAASSQEEDAEEGGEKEGDDAGAGGEGGGGGAGDMLLLVCLATVGAGSCREAALRALESLVRLSR